jgi:hypothetical protein
MKELELHKIRSIICELDNVMHKGEILSFYTVSALSMETGSAGCGVVLTMQPIV